MRNLLNYIERFWPHVVRTVPTDSGTLIGLPFPYLVPCDAGGQGMFQEMYYWDSFFISLGLIGTPHEAHVIGMAENMAHLIDRFGLIPNSSRYYMLSRSQPPLFHEQVNLALDVMRRRGDGADALSAFVSRMLDRAEREHETVWLGEAQPHHRRVYRGLSRYFDINYLDVLASCESGWDHSTRCDDKWLDHLPVDLNSILHMRETALADWADGLGQPERARRWRDAADARAVTVNELCWDPASGLYCDYNWRTQARSPHASLAAFYPLWAGLASAEQARQLVERWLPKFLQPGGLVTTLVASADRQWAWPNGWAPLQWIAAQGLARYGFHAEAAEIKRRWVATVDGQFERSGKCFEKYNVVDPAQAVSEGVYGQLEGFGWTNGVVVDFLRAA